MLMLRFNVLYLAVLVMACAEFCRSPPMPSNTLVVPASCATQPQQVDAQCQFHCAHGYAAYNGSAARQCRADYTWSGRALVCEPYVSATPGLCQHDCS
jgi:hypothetical protein